MATSYPRTRYGCQLVLVSAAHVRPVTVRKEVCKVATR